MQHPSLHECYDMQPRNYFFQDDLTLESIERSLVSVPSQIYLRCIDHAPITGQILSWIDERYVEM